MTFTPVPVQPVQPATVDQEHTLLVALQKGGTGKSTAVSCLASSLARLGLSVLVIDFAPNQTLTTTMLGFEPDPEEGESTPTVADLVTPPVEDGSAAEFIIQAPEQWQPRTDISWSKGGAYREGGAVWMIPGSPSLQRSADAVGEAGAELRLKKALAGVAQLFDLVIIDTDPSAGHVLHMALEASAFSLSPSNPQSGAVDGITKQFKELNRFAAAASHPIRNLGVLCQKLDKRNSNAHQQGLDEIWELLENQPELQATALEVLTDVEAGPVRRGALYPQIMPLTTQVEHAQNQRSPLSSQYPAARRIDALYTQAALRTLQLMKSDRFIDLADELEEDPLPGVWPLLPDDAPPNVWRQADGD